MIYGLPNFDGNIHKKDLSHPSPYNTYRWAGLPPGPIASPGAQSIQAALVSNAFRVSYISSRRTMEPISFPRHSWNIIKRWKNTRSAPFDEALIRRP